MGCIDVNNMYNGASIALTIARDTTDGSTVTFDQMDNVIVILSIAETFEAKFSRETLTGYEPLIRVDEDTLLLLHDAVEDRGLIRFRVECDIVNPLFTGGIQKKVGETELINVL
jgi:hypothetical protein